jgi:aryl-alcohol dehydrogenase-like predicted oxidoreductase
MSGSGATAEGTARYAARFAGRAAGEHFRSGPAGLTLSSIGLGTYLGRDDEATDRAYREAIVAAVEGGLNVLDSAVNYRFERSERALGAALSELAGRGFARDELVVATKGGYVPARDPESYFRSEILQRGLARAEDLVAGCHCLAPGYLRHQLDASLRNLGLERVDVYYLHNPEQQLEEVAPEAFAGRMRAAFEALEAAAAEGRVGVYGTATWNGYRVPPGSPGALSLERLFGLAREVAGAGHRFRAVQLPLNLAMTEAYGNATQSVDGGPASLLDAAAHFEVAVATSASILQGRLARGLPSSLGDSFPGLVTDAQRALQFTRSAPGVTTALVGMSRVEHVRENLVLVGVPPAPEAFASLFQPG